MSNTFTYEIDERNLRIQLRSAEIPLKEDAWKKFESYCETNTLVQTKTKFRGFEFTLNRNVVVPAVFGVIIILFSFLLFNFITVKNPRVEKISEPVQVSVPEVEVNNMVVANAQPEKTPSPQKQNTPAIDNSAATTEKSRSSENLADIEPTVESVPAESNSLIVSAVEQEASSTNAVSVIDTAKEEAIQKQKRRKKREEETLSSIKPTIITDEEDASVIPNLSE